MNLNLAGLQLAVEVGINFDGPRIADTHVLTGRRPFTGPDLPEQSGRDFTGFAALSVPRRESFVERRADFARDKRHDVPKRFIVVRAQIDAVNRRNQGLAPDAEQPLLHVAEDFTDEVVALQTPWR